MANRIGLLLPRSTDYPALGFDILDGLRYNLSAGEQAAQFISENTGFGEDQSLTYSKAEKLLLQDDVDIVVSYCHAGNAEPLYGLAEASGKPFLFVDAGMQLPQAAPNPYCFHISLQGIHACRVAGYLAGEKTKRVLMATSFYDGGYRGPWGYVRGLEAAGGMICGNYVSGYKQAEFSIDNYMFLLQQSGAESVAACFSSYLADLFIKALKEKNPEAISLPFYCSPFMAEEQLLAKCDFPGGTMHAVVPWATSLRNEEQELFTSTIKKEKNKQANIFHLLGWEAAIIIRQIKEQGVASMNGFSYKSPRGNVTMHAGTHYTYAPLYKGIISAGDNNKCVLDIEAELPVTTTDHELVQNDRPEMETSSGWRNNYLCI